VACIAPANDFQAVSSLEEEIGNRSGAVGIPTLKFKKKKGVNKVFFFPFSIHGARHLVSIQTAAEERQGEKGIKKKISWRSFSFFFVLFVCTQFTGVLCVRK